MDVMSEPRRLHFTTIGPMGKEKKKKSSLPPTIRFTLALRESNDKTCPEFSYADLMKNALGDCKNAEPGDFDLEDQNENERLVALARSFEERYGPKHSKTQSKRCDAIQDLVDLGDGYDETDPFVDNSEAYDELVPACLTTKLGGFYINSGVLDFRDVSDDSSNEFVSSPIKKKKKRVVITSDTESDGEMKKKIPKIRKLKDGMNKERRKKSLADKEFKKPRKPTNKDLLRKKTPSTVKELLKQQPVTVPNILTNSPTFTTPIPSPVTPTIVHTITTTTVTTSNITTTNTTSVSTSNNDHESDPNGNNYSITTPSIGLLSQDKSSSSSSGYMVTTPTIPSSGVQENDAVKVESGLNISVPFNNVKEDSNSREPDIKPSDPESIPKLGEGIPDPLEKTINQLKQAAEDSVEGKCKFFTSEVNKMLLEIETESRLLNSSQRSSIYNHLAAFLPCSKETLLKRAKKLILTHQDDKLKEPTQRLRDAINEEMPGQLEKYKNEYHGTSVENPNPTTDNSDLKEEGSTESDEDKSTETDKNEKKCLIIKKKFEWNDKIRSLLCDIVKLKLESYGMSKLRAQSAEEYLKSFLKMEVKPLWPKGWMHVRILFKESRSVHNKMTLYKAKKVPLVNKPPLSISVGNVPNTNTKDTSPHSNNSLANIHLDSPTGYPNAKTDVTPILTAIANEMKEPSPTSVPEKLSENKTVWNLLEYADCQPLQQNQTFGENLPMNSTPIGLLNSVPQIPLYFPHASPDGSIKEEQHNQSESIKESQSSVANNTSSSSSSMYHHNISSSSNINMIPVPLLSTQTSSSSQQISPTTMPSVKASYSHISPTATPTSTKQQQSQGISSINLGGNTSLHSQAQFSNNQTIPSSVSDSDPQNLPSQSVAALLAKHSPQQASPTGIQISDPMSPNFSYGHKDSSSALSQLMKPDAKNQHNQTISGTPVPNLPLQVSPTYQNLNKQKDSSPPLQNKLSASAAASSSPQINVQVMTKIAATKKDPSLPLPPPPATNPEMSQNSGNSSPSGQFSPKDDCKNTYLAEFQRYAASCLKTPLTSSSQKVKIQQPAVSVTTVPLATTPPVSKGLDVKALPLPQQTRSSYQLTHSLTTPSPPTQHHLGKIDVPSSGQQTQLSGHPTHMQQQQQIQQQQKPMSHGMSQNLHQPHHTPKSHPSSSSSHPPLHHHQQHSKQWRPQQSSQQHNRHQSMQQQQPQKSYSSSSSSSSSQHASLKPPSMSTSPISPQVVNYQPSQQQQQLNVQKQSQSHVKVQSQQPRTTISQQHQHQQQQQTKTDNVVLKQQQQHHPTPSPVQTVSPLTASSAAAATARHPHHHHPPQTSVMNTTTTNANNKIVTGVASSSQQQQQRGGIGGMHSLHSTPTTNLNIQSQTSSLKQQQQTRTHCLESALAAAAAAAASPSTTPSTTSAAASLSSTSSGSVYKLPTITNITSSVVGAASHQHPSYSFSQPTSHTVTSLPQQQQQQGLMRSQGQAGLLQLRAVLPSKNTGGGGGYTAISSSSSSQGISSAQTWNISGGGGISQASATSSPSSSSCKQQNSSPVFSSSYLQQQHGSAALLSTTSPNYPARNLPGLALDKIHSSLSGSIPASQLNQESTRHSKSSKPSKPRFMAVSEKFYKNKMNF